ncbi:GNAT family N-acetyltransferase [Alphaproteobacteria bacterium AO1-B]|nr:GNAT family N-acetyltransferase [Alphaproteobacteria bacterium AO1-B]
MAVRWCLGERKIPLSGNVETDRLLLTRPRLSEVPEFYGFLGDPWAMQFTQIDKDLASCRRRIAVHEWRRRRDGFAPWTVRVKGEPEIIGWGGLYDDPFDPGWGPELAFFYHPKAWGQGYGAELSLAALKVADIKIELPLVSAFAHPKNVASQKLLQKVGFQPERHVESMNRILYRRRRPAR